MHLLIAAGSVPFAQASLAPSTGTAQYATDGNPGAGIPATIAPAWHYNMLMTEIYNVVVNAGLTPSDTNWDQLDQAITARLGHYLPLAGGTVTGDTHFSGALYVAGNMIPGAIQTAGDVFSSNHIYSGPVTGNFTPCQSASLGSSMSNGQINAYNSSGSSGQFGTAAAGDIVDFWVGNVGTISIQGKITTTGTGVTYGTTSDRRLKQDIVPLTGALERFDRLQARRFAFKAEPGRVVDGFIADEVAPVVPIAVSGAPDAVREDGSIDPQTFSAADLVPLLWATVGELRAKVTALEAAIASIPPGLVSAKA